jgi:hypothetical protein
VIDDVQFMGRKIGEKERLRLESVFGVKIDDLPLLHAILAIAAHKDCALERGAFTRALKHGYCSDADGGRAAKALIQKMRKKMGYQLSVAGGLKAAIRKKKKT